MKKITTFLGCVGVVCLFSGCSSEDDLEKLVMPNQPVAEVLPSSDSNTPASSANTSTVSNSSSNSTPQSASSPMSSGEVVPDTVHKQVVIKSSASSYTDPYFSSGVFCWTKECEAEWAGVTSSSAATASSSSMTIDIGTSVEAPVYPRIDGDMMTDLRDNQTYKLVTIGGTRWMANDLKYATADGSTCFESKDANCASYGRLYTFAAAQKACPTGWRLPNRDEAQAAIDATNMPWSYSGRCVSSDCKFLDGMGFHWTTASQQEGDKLNTDNCNSGESATAVIIVEKNPDSDYKADVANFFQVDCRAKLFSVRCVEGTL